MYICIIKIIYYARSSFSWKKIPKIFKISGIYKIQIKEHVYIGSSKNIQNRLSNHRKTLRSGKHKNPILRSVYNKYGESEMIISVLEICEVKDLLVKEKYWIDLLNPDLNIIRDPTKHPTSLSFNKGTAKEVHQYDLDGNYINSYPSVQEAGRQLNIADTRSISLCASKHKHNKQKAGFQWSYEKVEKMPKYINNSSKAKITTLYVFDIFNNKEYKFDSVASAVRELTPNCENFNSMCALFSASGNITCGKYLTRHENQKYKIPSRNSWIYNTKLNKIFQNAKIASKELNISSYKIKENCRNCNSVEWQYVTSIAREKLREPGKIL